MKVLSSFLKSAVFLLTVACLLFASFVLPASAEVPESLYTVGMPSLDKAETVLFKNLDSGRVLASKGGIEYISPGVTVKMLAGLTALPMCVGRQEETVTVTEEMTREFSGAKIPLEAGDTVTVNDLLVSLLCGGYNDAATVLAFTLAGSTEAFLENMTAKAEEIGLSDTVVKNVTGMDAEGAGTSLSDVVKLAEACMANESYMSFCSLPNRVIRIGENEFKVYNRNALLSSRYAEGYICRSADGLCAGMTDEAGYCCLASATLHGCRYLVVVMGAVKEGNAVHSFALAQDLLEYANQNLVKRELVKPGMKILSVPVEGAVGDGEAEVTVECRVGEHEDAFVPVAADTSELRLVPYLYTTPLQAPVAKGTRVGGVDVYCGDTLLATLPLVTGEEVYENTFLRFLDSVRHAILSTTTLNILVLWVIGAIPWYFFSYRKARRKLSSPHRTHFIFR